MPWNPGDVRCFASKRALYSTPYSVVCSFGKSKSTLFSVQVVRTVDGGGNELRPNRKPMNGMLYQNHAVSGGWVCIYGCSPLHEEYGIHMCT